MPFFSDLFLTEVFLPALIPLLAAFAAGGWAGWRLHLTHSRQRLNSTPDVMDAKWLAAALAESESRCAALERWLAEIEQDQASQAAAPLPPAYLAQQPGQPPRSPVLA